MSLSLDAALDLQRQRAAQARKAYKVDTSPLDPRDYPHLDRSGDIPLNDPTLFPNGYKR